MLTTIYLIRHSEPLKKDIGIKVFGGKNGVTDEILDLLKKYIQIKGEHGNKNLV